MIGACDKICSTVREAERKGRRKSRDSDRMDDSSGKDVHMVGGGEKQASVGNIDQIRSVEALQQRFCDLIDSKAANKKLKVT